MYPFVDVALTESDWRVRRELRVWIGKVEGFETLSGGVYFSYGERVLARRKQLTFPALERGRRFEVGGR